MCIVLLIEVENNIYFFSFAFLVFVSCNLTIETENVCFIHLTVRQEKKSLPLSAHEKKKIMPEPMSLLEQVNAFKKSNRQHLIIDRTVRRRPAVYSSFNHIDNENIELKTLSLDVYATNHLLHHTKSTLSPSERTRLGKLLLPSIGKDMNSDENYRCRKKRRPSYRQSLYHSRTPNSNETDLAEINARGTKPELHVMVPTCRDDETVISAQRDEVPPPSPSDEIDRLFRNPYDQNASRSPSPPPPPLPSVEKEGYIPYRLPKLRQSARFRRTPNQTPGKDIRSTLSNYLRRYY